jgi:hypothetical protein
MTFQRPPSRGQGGEPKRIPRGRLALWLALGGIITAMLSVPWIALSFGLFISAFIIGIRARIEAKRTSDPIPARGAIAAIVIGSIGMTIGLIGIAGIALLYPEISRFDECRLGANTEIARADCMEQLRKEITQRLNR